MREAQLKQRMNKVGVKRMGSTKVLSSCFKQYQLYMKAYREWEEAEIKLGELL